MPLLEHINLTVSDARRTAKRLSMLFEWKIRWQGPAQAGGYTLHIGNDRQYIAVYQPPGESNGQDSTENGPLNHIGILVSDLTAAEARVRSAGLTPHSFGQYQPGRRFYFRDSDHIEYEIVSY